MKLEQVTSRIIQCGMEVHSALGPGLMESAYRACLYDELLSRGTNVRREWPVAVQYKDRLIDIGYRIDLLVEEQVVVELKAVDKLHAVHEAQLLSYLRLSKHPVGLLINFNVVHLRLGIRRKVL